MTCRPMLWIAATAVALGVAASAPSPAPAQSAPPWDVTIDSPAPGAEVATKHLTITGTAAFDLGVRVPAASVTVTVVPQGLPPDCGGPITGAASMDSEQYTAAIPVTCNGPHQVQVVANGVAPSSTPITNDIWVAEKPAQPAHPLADQANGQMVVTWEPVTGPDAVGSILRVDGEELPIFGPEDTSVTLPLTGHSTVLAVRTVRLGGRPGTRVMSDYSWDNIWTPTTRPTTTPDPDPDPDPDPTPDPPPSDPSPGPGPGPSGPSTPGGATPPPTNGNGNGGTAPPTRGTGAPSTTLPEGYSEELPFGAPDDAFVPGAEPNRRPSNAGERAVASVEPVSGLVRTTEPRSPGLVAPFALGLLMITIAAHIAWYLRRSRPPGAGQVRPS